MVQDREHVADIIGYIGIVFLVLLLIPQIYKTYTIRHTEGISLTMILLELGVSLCYLIYGVLLSQLPLIIGNCFALIMSIILLFMFCYFPNKAPKQYIEG